MISRYVLWNQRTPSIASAKDLGTVVHEIISCSGQELPIPQALPVTQRLAVRQYLMEAGIGGEVVLSLMDGRPTLFLASGVTIAEMELSVRAYNCLKAASIETLDELLSWKPSQLMDLPHFGRKCLNEITEIIHRLGYLRFGNETADVEAQREVLRQEGSSPMACLLDVRELVSEGGLAEGFIAHGLAQCG
jgi:DNA-directed RNA polymerase subunit alpha